MEVVKYLRDKEWSMGHGQCPECCGGQPDKWFPHPCYDSKDEEGHQPDCKLAKSLEDVGEKVSYALITQKMKNDKNKEQWMDFVCMTVLGIKAKKNSIGRKLQEEYWKKYPHIAKMKGV